MNADLMPAKIGDALHAISLVQGFLFKENLMMQNYALESAYQTIEEVKKLIENGDLVTRQKVADYAAYFEEYHDTAADFTAEQFLIDFDEFESEVAA